MKLTVVVLGDVGRSPRMQYHALSLSAMGEVTLVGLLGEPCIAEVEDKCIVKTIPDSAAGLGKRVPYIIRAPIRAIILSCKLLLVLLSSESDLFLVQNPPTIPTLPIVALAAWWTGATLVIDWHNLGFKMFDPSRAAAAALIFSKVTWRVEQAMARWVADENFTVTSALKHWLEENAMAREDKVTVLYDRPFSRFQVADVDEDKRSLFAPLPLPKEITYENCFANKTSMLLVTSTSWTEDEDFDMLLDALTQYSGRTRLHLVITGKGPLLAKYAPLLASNNNVHCTMHSIWFTQRDYPRFLQLCSLGISMHTSTSGLDLPMKVIDMFGSGLPVLAKRFDCVGELVREGKNGLLFSSARELAQQLERVCDGDQSLLSEMRQYVAQHEAGQGGGWEVNWQTCAKPVIERALKRTRRKRRGLFGLLVVVLLTLLAFLLAVVVV